MTERTNGTLLRAVCVSILLPLGSARAQDEREPLPVQIVTVQPTVDERDLSLTGEVTARKLLSASFPDSGRIVALTVERGDRVTKGMVLAELESALQEQALRSAKAALHTAQATAQTAKEDADRQDGLLERGATTTSARDTAADTLRAARASVAQAAANLDRARQALADTVLRAPADATVTEKPAEVGQVIATAQTVLKLAIGNRYDAVFQLPEALLATASDTRPTEVSLAPLGKPDDAITGTLRRIAPFVDAMQGTVKVTVTMPGLPNGLQIGDPVVGTVKWTEAPRIVLPWASLSAWQGQPAVWVVDPDRQSVSLRQVQVLRYETERIVVNGGLETGEQVVGLGANLLYPGRTVRAVEVE